MRFWNEYNGWIKTIAVIVAIICACTLKCGPVIWIILLVAWTIAAMRAQGEREYQNERIRKGYRDDD